jgi:hypothetical protein
VHVGIAVHLTGRGQKEAGPVTVGQFEATAGPLAADGEGLQRQGQIVGRGGRTGQIEDAVDDAVDGQGRRDVGLHQ